MNDSTAKTDADDFELDDLVDINSIDDFDDDFQDIDEPLNEASDATETTKNKQGRFWITVAIISLVFVALINFLLLPMVNKQLERADWAAEMIKSVGLTNVSARQALTESGQFKPVETYLLESESTVNNLVVADSITDSLATPLFGNGQLNVELSSAWNNYKTSAESFLSNQQKIDEIKSKLAGLGAQIAGSMNETVAFSEAVSKEGRSQTSADNKNKYLFLTAESSNLNGILGRLSATVSDYYSPSAKISSIANQQNGLMVVLQDTLSRILGNASEVVTTSAAPLQEKYQALAVNISEVGDRASALFAAKTELEKMDTQVALLRDVASKAQTRSALVTFLDKVLIILLVLLTLLALYALWRYTKSQSQDVVANELLLEDTLAEQQESILKLLDEMSALADGDLTVEAEVTDQITGAIADSVNYAVIEMRDLVSQINRASLEVANESASAVENAQSVSQSNAKQATEISAAAQLMQRVSNSMRAMSKQANSSAAMASESISAATQGAVAVRDTIKGMEDMREQIQDTSKRIKRLGESSQRIGDIVALIDDIAEQTNILSLNAAIQASMAGEAGRGFAVVSDEVQSLAERSTEATKKIAELVTTIQNDTNDAVLSMEKATEQVVSGTKVADTAGNALLEIENVSKRLSELINDISKGSNEQAEVVTKVTEQVSNVSKSSTETSRKSQDSANSIAKLLELAKELESSVTRFKLPAS